MSVSIRVEGTEKQRREEGEFKHTPVMTQVKLMEGWDNQQIWSAAKPFKSLKPRVFIYYNACKDIRCTCVFPTNSFSSSLFCATLFFIY